MTSSLMGALFRSCMFHLSKIVESSTFNLSGLSQPILSVELVLPVFSSNPFPFTIDVFGYAGDGALTLSDWDQGSLLTSFSYSGEQTVTLDVTSFIHECSSCGRCILPGSTSDSLYPSPIHLNGPFVAFTLFRIPPFSVLDDQRIVAASFRSTSSPAASLNSINPKSNGEDPGGHSDY